MLKKAAVIILAILLIVAMLLPTVFSFGEENDDAAPITSTDDADFSLIFIHDMHSHLEKAPKLKTFLDQARGVTRNRRGKIIEAKNENKVMLVDAGDFAMGTPYHTVFSTNALELQMLGFLNCQVTTLGNHEFDFKSRGLSKMLQSAMKLREDSSRDNRLDDDEKVKLPDMVISNIDWKATLNDGKLKEDGQILKDTLNAYGSAEYKVYEKNGKKIAVFGIFGKDSAEVSPESGTKFIDPIAAAKEIVAKINKEQTDVDLIVCLSHSGTNPQDPKNSEDELLAKQVDGIDVIISGHTHTLYEQPLKVNNTIIASCGSFLSHVGQIDFKTDTDGKLKMTNYKTIALDEKIPDDEQTQELLKEYKKVIDKEFFGPEDMSWDGTLTTSTFDMTPIEKVGEEQGEDPLGNLISDSFIYAVREAEGESYEPVALSVVPAGIIRASIKAGNITGGDAFNILSLGTGMDGKPGYPIVSIYLTGKEIRNIAEVDASISTIMRDATLSLSGVKYTINDKRLFLNRIEDIKLISEGKEQKLEDDKLYRVVGDLYSTQMLGSVGEKSHGLLQINPKDKDGKEIKDFTKHIVRRSDGSELKEWFAVASYLKSFGADGVPSTYAAKEGRKTIISEFSLSHFFRNPNSLFKLLLGIIGLAILIFILIIVLIVKIFRRIKYGKGGKPKSIRAPKQASIFSHRKNKYKTKW